MSPKDSVQCEIQNRLATLPDNHIMGQWEKNTWQDLLKVLMKDAL